MSLLLYGVFISLPREVGCVVKDIASCSCLDFAKILLDTGLNPIKKPVRTITLVRTGFTMERENRHVIFHKPSRRYHDRV